MVIFAKSLKGLRDLCQASTPRVFVAEGKVTSPALAEPLSLSTTPLAPQRTNEYYVESNTDNTSSFDVLLTDLHGNIIVDEVHDQLTPGVKGRLKENINFWELIGASSWVLKVIRDGYALPFIDIPQQRMSENHKSAKRCEKFVVSEIEKLLCVGCIKEVSGDQVHVVSPLSVASNNGKNRLILDLRYVNSCLRVLKFKYEDLRIFKDIFRPGDWIFKFDYKSGYHHVDIFPPHWQYLAFSWGEGSDKRFFVFTVLPFGLATAPYVFTKVQKALLKHWRLQGIRIFTYLDDGIGGHSSVQEAKAVSNRVRSDVEQSGFLWHPDKSLWEPTQCGEVLGFVVNLAEGYFRVPERRIVTLNNQLHTIQSNNYQTTAYSIAKLTGTIISMGLALGPIARLWTRGLYRNLMSTTSWGERVHLNHDAITEVKFWLDSFEECHGQKIWLSDPMPEVLTYSDASNTGWGGYCVQIAGQIAKGSWTPEEAEQSSTWRELRATHLVLLSYVDQFHGKEVRHRTDNKNVELVLQIGSSSKLIHDEVIAIYKLCRQNAIRLYPEWVPRKHNIEADYLSRQTDQDDYMLNPLHFAALDILWGPHTVDRFASFNTRQIPRFCSRWLSPCTETVDAFTVSWKGENNWMFPPPFLIGKVISHLCTNEEDGTLIVPLWSSAPWWPLLTIDGRQPMPWITEWLDIPLAEDTFIPAVEHSCLFGSGIPSYRVLALKVRFNQAQDTTNIKLFI